MGNEKVCTLKTVGQGRKGVAWVVHGQGTREGEVPDTVGRAMVSRVRAGLEEAGMQAIQSTGGRGTLQGRQEGFPTRR